MTLVILYAVTFAIFMGLDYVGLSFLIKPTFEKDVGGLLLEDFRLVPAFVFYAFYEIKPSIKQIWRPQQEPLVVLEAFLSFCSNLRILLSFFHA